MYKTKTKFTYEEFKRYEDECFKKKNLIITFISALILIIIGIFLTVSYKDYIFIIGVSIGVLVGVIGTIIRINNTIKKLWESNKIIQNAEVEYTFYDDHFEQKSNVSNSKIKYDMIYKIVETKTNFYIFISTNQGYIINKENCKEKLIELIRNLKK